MGRAGCHLPDQYKEREVVKALGAWHNRLNSYLDSHSHRLSWNIRSTVKEISFARTSMQQRARAINEAVMGGDSRDKARNVKAREGPAGMDISLALSLLPLTFDPAKNFKGHEGNWILALMVLTSPTRLVSLLYPRSIS